MCHLGSSCETTFLCRKWVDGSRSDAGRSAVHPVVLELGMLLSGHLGGPCCASDPAEGVRRGPPTDRHSPERAGPQVSWAS